MKKLKKPNLIVLLFFSCVLCFSHYRACAQDTKNIFYMLHFTKKEGVTASLSVNDVPLENADEQPSSSIENLNTWVMPGENMVKIKLERPATLHFDEGYAGIELTVELQDPEAPEDTKTILEYKWPGKDSVKLPFKKEFALTVDKEEQNFNFHVSKARGIRVKVLVNNTPVEDAGLEGEGQNFIVYTLNALEGKNTVSLMIEKHPDYPVYREGEKGMEISIREALEGQMSDEGTPALSFVWPEKLPAQLPFETTLTFKANNPPPVYFWKAAAPIVLNGEEKKAIFELLTKLHKAFSEKNKDEIAELMFYALSEKSKAQYAVKTEKEIKDENKKMLNYLLTKTAVLKALSFDALEFHLIAQKRIVWVTVKDFKSPITITDAAEESTSEVPVYVAPVKGKWTFVR